MFNKIHLLFKALMDGNDLAAHTKAEPNLAIAALLCEVSAADSQSTKEEIEAEQNMLVNLLSITAIEAQQLLTEAREKSKQSVSLYDFTSQLRELPRSQRFELVKAMWTIAYADGVLDPIEESIIRKVAELIYLDHKEFVRAKLEVQGV